MVHVSQLPCNGDGMCMQCNEIPTEEEKLYCKTCATPWHVECLARPLESLASTLQWECPDCAGDVSVVVSGQAVEKSGIVAEILAIQADASLTESEKARRRQELMSGNSGSDGGDETTRKKEKGKDKVVDGGENEELNIFDGNLKCSFCINILERPVTTPCGHNFCLKCFQKWIGLGKDTCATCRCRIPSKMASQPRINSTLVAAIRMANSSKSTVSGGPSKVYHYVHNQDRPDKAYTTERAKKNGKANAASGKIFVTVPPDHFGPILAESDPVRNQGVLIGELWEGRLECRQWGVHYPPVAGIAGQAKHGAQSVVLSGGYEDDEDHGEWFLYTGSGGRDLSGNKRTNMNQSFDQKFEKMNEALRISCKKGYPVRVVRSFKEKRSSYAPEKGLRYDGIYRIEECWRKVGIQGFKVCRYLFVRCDNDPAPWTSDEHGDRPRPLPIIPEIKNAFDITKRKESPSWDFDVNGCWKWIKPPPLSRAVGHKGTSVGNNRPMGALKKGQHKTIREKLLKEFSCLICKQVMAHPVTTPCAHNFCKLCLEEAFAGQSFVRERSNSVRMLRAQKNIMKCPSCANDISDFLKDTQVNRELMEVIESLKKRAEDNDELTGETGEEETDVSEGIPDPTPESSNSCGENHEETGVNGGGSKNPTMTCKPERANKRKKVDVGDCSEESGENHEETSVIGSSQNPTMTCKPERVNESKKVDVEGNTVKKSDREENQTATEKVDSEAGKLEAGNVNLGTKEMEAEAALKEGNDSPASPFLMASDGQDSSWLSD